MLSSRDPLVSALVDAIRTGDVEGLVALLVQHPGLAAERVGDAQESRTTLHLATDWPGNRPRVAESIAALVAAGASVDGRFVGAHTETALHWAASADDVEAIEALLDAGADLEATGAVLTGGTPLSDAVIFAQWKAARVLVERGATMTIWQAAALGEVDRMAELLGSATRDDITNACWHACRAGRLSAVELLVAQGADLDWVGHDDLTPRQAGLASQDARLVAWLESV